MQELVLPNYDINGEGRKVWLGCLRGPDWRAEVLRLGTGLGGGAVRLERHEGGKPYFAEGCDWEFNVTNTRDLTLAAFAREAVGLDVEHGERRVHADSLARRYFSKEEADWLEEEAEEMGKRRRFLILWTAREAVIKLDGCGLSRGLGRSRVFIPEGEEMPGRAWLEEREAVLRYVEWPGGYLVCVAGWAEFELALPSDFPKVGSL